MPNPQFVNPVTVEIIEAKSIERWDHKPIFIFFRDVEDDLHPL